MEIITSYKAVDGVIFEDEEECKLYEFRITHIPEHLMFWEEDGVTYIDEEGTPERVDRSYNRAIFMDVAEFEGKIFSSVDDMIDFVEDYFGWSMDGVDGSGRYKWDDWHFKWVKIDG